MTIQLSHAALTQIWNFPKLKSQQNYQSWVKKMKSALMYSDLWNVVQNANKDFLTNLSVTSAPTTAQATAYQTQLKTWKQTNN